MFHTRDPDQWGDYSDGSVLAVEPGPYTIVLRAYGRAALYLIDGSFDAVSDEDGVLRDQLVPAENAVPVLVASLRDGEREIRVNVPRHMFLLFRSEESGSYFVREGQLTPAPMPDQPSFTVIKPRATVSEDVRAMMRLLKVQEAAHQRQLTEAYRYAQTANVAPAPAPAAPSAPSGADGPQDGQASVLAPAAAPNS